jgi:hypothetical protein
MNARALYLSCRRTGYHQRTSITPKGFESHTQWNLGNLAGRLVEEMLTKSEMDDFLTSVYYPYIVTAQENNGTAARL